MSRPINWPAEPYNGYMGWAKPTFGAKSEKNHSPLKFRRLNKAENNAEIRQQTLILSWACERIRMPLMLQKATCISPVARSIAGGCHGASWHFSHTSFTGSPFSMTVLTLAVLTHCRADMQLPWHLPRGLIHTLHVEILHHSQGQWKISAFAGWWNLLPLRAAWLARFSKKGKEKRKENVSCSIWLHLGMAGQMNQALQHSYPVFLPCFMLLTLARPTKAEHNSP